MEILHAFSSTQTTSSLPDIQSANFLADTSLWALISAENDLDLISETTCATLGETESFFPGSSLSEKMRGNLIKHQAHVTTTSWSDQQKLDAPISGVPKAKPLLGTKKKRLTCVFLGKITLIRSELIFVGVDSSCSHLPQSSHRWRVSTSFYNVKTLDALADVWPTEFFQELTKINAVWVYMLHGICGYADVTCSPPSCSFFRACVLHYIIW